MTRAVLVLLAACHLTAETETIRAGASHFETTGEPSPGKPTLAITDDGHVKIIEPLACASEEVVEQEVAITTTVRPNIATFVVGAILTAAGGTATARGAIGGDGAITAIGVGVLAVGLPLAIGPFLGNSTVDRPGPARPPLRHPGPVQACGERPLAATHATLSVRGMSIRGKVEGGVFAIPIGQWLDAYAPPQDEAWDVQAAVETPSGDRVINAVIPGEALERGAKGFLAHADFDAAIEPLRVVPNLTASTAVVLIATDDGPAARVTIAVQNAGPGDSYALRGTIETQVAALDGRVIYVGRVAKNATVTRVLVIPLADDAANALRGATIDLAVQLRDAHGTAPELPIRFRGTIK